MTTWPKSWLADSPGAPCPTRGERAGRPILMGMPSGNVFEALDAGEIDIALGGCCISGDDPTHRCSSCGTSVANRQSRTTKQRTQ